MKPKSEYEDRTVADLVTQLRLIGLQVGGSKAVLIARLEGHYRGVAQLKFGSHSSRTAAAFAGMAQLETPGTVNHCGDCGSNEHVGGSPDCPVAEYIKQGGRVQGLKTYGEHQKQLTKEEGSVIPLLPCPKCQRAMVVRKNRTNGSLFYGCSAFSAVQQCSGTRQWKVGQVMLTETFRIGVYWANTNSSATDSGSGSAFRR